MITTDPMIPLPLEFGIKDFPHYRHLQDHMIMEVSADPHRIIGLRAGTGTGKSLVAMIQALMSEGRTLILTATKGLQSQYQRDFTGLVADLKGQANYPCIALDNRVGCDEGPCHDGDWCSYKSNGCGAFDAVR